MLLAVKTQTFEPAPLERITLANHVVMTPMTRRRALGNVPNELMVEYYRQRAGAGLIITEGTAPAAAGSGYARIPGLSTTEWNASRARPRRADESV